mmetsp:Transcript_24860/g.63315  ORF Transcript_24860/g.63315 Transcript_24860/m.63315 type:complete len:228 (-) Transcript_24860:126-809(-)
MCARTTMSSTQASLGSIFACGASSARSLGLRLSCSNCMASASTASRGSAPRTRAQMGRCTTARRPWFFYSLMRAKRYSGFRRDGTLTASAGGRRSSQSACVQASTCTGRASTSRGRGISVANLSRMEAFGLPTRLLSVRASVCRQARSAKAFEAPDPRSSTVTSKGACHHLRAGCCCTRPGLCIAHAVHLHAEAEAKGRAGMAVGSHWRVYSNRALHTLKSQIVAFQ